MTKHYLSGGNFAISENNFFTLSVKCDEEFFNKIINYCPDLVVKKNS